MVNQEARCMTSGDANTDDIDVVLQKYYTYNYENLQVLKVHSNQYFYVGDGLNTPDDRFAVNALNWILSQEDID